MSSEILHSRIADRFNDIFEVPPEIPNYIYDNLNHNLRPYQEEALRHYIYTQRTNVSDISFNHTLFHMATGSGKTLVLAATILYLYKEKGHQNFIFFVNSDAIIKKTFDNLTNSSSSKYLFNSKGIIIDGAVIDIKLVDVFPKSPSINTIYLKLTTIQRLHMDLTNPRENGVTYKSLESESLVLLADEAHHINAITRNSKKNLNIKELEEKTWENTVSNLLSLNPANRLLEYTATIDLNNEALFNKYRDKIVFQYDLKKFMEDGYSKNVVLLRANEEDSEKMLSAILLSQYRKYVARDFGIELKPIILFKSNKIAVSLGANSKFLSILEGLTEENLERTINQGMAIYQNTNSVWNKMFSYYKNQNLIQVIKDLKWDFKRETILNANDASFLSEENTLLLNTLEDINNPIRTIFAVAKLNEGWDVLNLFDIVRISEGGSNTKSTTDSEAQLIGRGARYYPFYIDNQSSYKRRFDLKGSDLKIIETLHYHTINDSAYINSLEKSLKASNVQVQEDQYERLTAKVKNKIRKMDFFKHGKIYINKLVSTSADDYQSLKDYNVSKIYDTQYETVIEQHYLSGDATIANVKKHQEVLKVSKELLQKALQRNPFYRFENLKSYIPAISSLKDFINKEEFLGGLEVNLSLPQGITTADLSSKEKLEIIERFLNNAEKSIRTNYMKERGTPIFEGISLSKVIDDYVVEMNQINKKINITQVIRPRNMKEYDWYIYDQAIVNGLENSMIDFLNDYVEKLRAKYHEVYLIRNERKIKIVEIDGIRGFMPDFLLYMKDKNFTYQVFLEPKGERFKLQDQWKEDFLLSLTTRPDIEVLSENEDVRIIGVKFFGSDSESKQEFRKDFEEKLL